MTVFIIMIHQIVFQGMFIAKNIYLRRKLGLPIRGGNREANLSIGFFVLFIILSVLLGLFESPLGTVNLLMKTTSMSIALPLLAVNLVVGSASLLGLRDSWRVGVLENQQTDLIEVGIYRFSRNPYFLSYLIMFAAYTILLQNIILLVLSLVGFFMIHAMILKEEKYLKALHGEQYRQYRERVPRYIII
ncbi:methyltransferase family protein [Candidatus Latescibacterota bacterium]